MFFNSLLYFPENGEILKGQLVSFIDRNSTVGHLSTTVTELLEKTLSQISLLDSVCLRAPRLEKNIVVYRGLRGDIAMKLKKLRKGQEYITKTFSSTAFDFNVALGFTFGVRPHAVILRINLPAGTPYVLLPGGPHQDFGEMTFEGFMKTVRSSYDQTELVLSRGSRLQVTGTSKRQRISPLDNFSSEDYKSEGYIDIIDMRFILPEDDTLPQLPTAYSIIDQLGFLEFPVSTE